MWYWFVIWTTEEESGEIWRKGFTYEWEAETNLVARLAEVPPNIGLPDGAWIVTYGVGWEVKGAGSRNSN